MCCVVRCALRCAMLCCCCALCCAIRCGVPYGACAAFVARAVTSSACSQVVRSGHGLALEEVFAGHRQLLLLELWNFSDASLGNRRPPASEGRPFSPSHNFKLEL